MTIDYIDEVRIEAAALHSAVESHPDAMVAACPDWTVAQLIGHVGQVYSGMGHIVRTRAETFVTDGFKVRAPEGPLLSAWFEERTMQILEDLEGIDEDTPVWTWGPEANGRFYHRRMAQETTVHRWDAEAAAGPASPIDADLAHDGIEELLAVGMRASTQGPRNPDVEGSLHLHRTDGDGEWLLRTDNGQLIVTHEHAKGDAAVRGSASALLLYLWGRSAADVEIFGDESVAAAWAALAP